MKKNCFLLILFSLITQWSMAQAPKWLDKSRRAVFSVITYGPDDNILNTGNGFFISEDGLALSDYTLFKGALRAVVVDCDGRQMQVSTIQGANSMYDVVKFRVATGGKKVAALPIATTGPVAEAIVYLLPYSTRKAATFTAGKVKEAASIGDNQYYYSLAMKLDDKMVSCPVMNEAGQVMGLAQKSSGKDAGEVCYAVGASYGRGLTVSALSVGDITLKSIGIKKGLPDTEEQALVYLYMSSSSMSAEEYEALLDDFIVRFPDSADGYVRRASNTIYRATDEASMDKVVADMDRALSVSRKKDDVHYNLAKLIYAYQLTAPEKVYKDWTYEKALSEVRTAAGMDPLPVYDQLEGDILFANKDYAGAFTCYEKVTKSNLASAAAFFSAAKAKEMAGGDISETVALMDSCIAYCSKPVTQDNAAYLLERARVYMEAKQYRQAMLDYDAYYDAVNAQVNDVFYYYREQACFHARQFQRALDDMNEAIGLNPEEVAYRAELAVVNIRVGRYEEAVKVLKDALAVDPEYSEAYRLMGIAQVQLKQQDEACANFARAKELGDLNVDSLIEKHCK
ncbi:MAG: tetratricopeptide repeat protein [Mediterranea sp.]|jgi:tetratricopeptide (TPR) repeat protein|nr:tetratricopeptide repeat protein [Mediterranea sp.]